MNNENYRVNFGNGQVHYCKTAKDCIREIRAQFDGPQGAFVQKYIGDGEWRKDVKASAEALLPEGGRN